MTYYDYLPQIVVASLGIIGVILIHHCQVRQEIKMRIAMKRFERKAGVYRKLMRDPSLTKLACLEMF